MIQKGRKPGTTKAKQNPSRIFGEVLKEMRLAKGISQEQLAFDANVHRTYVSQLERATKQPTLGTLLSLAEALGQPAHLLVRRVEERIAKIDSR